MINVFERIPKPWKGLGRMVGILLLSVGILFNGYSQVRKDIQIASFLFPDVSAAAFFADDARFSGGVSPLGSAQFYSPAGDEVAPANLKLRVIHPERFANSTIDFDAIGLEWNSSIYKMASIDMMLLSTMEFIKSESAIAYTIPMMDPDSSCLQKNRLVESGWAYFFEGFKDISQSVFLDSVDLDTRVKPLPNETQIMIVRSLGQSALQERNYDLEGSYVNTDIIVKYQVYLATEAGNKVVNVGGNPLRYNYQYDNATKKTSIWKVEMFSFPESAFNLQDKAFIFFQTTAILRRIYNKNPAEFDRFYNELKGLQK
jgi:hypothetical protein